MSVRLIKVAEWPDGQLANVVFVHGLGGHPYATWQAQQGQSTFWPWWLAEDIEGVSVFTLAYAAPITNWTGAAMPIQHRARGILEYLMSQRSLDAGPIVFICHSLGGLVVKQVLRIASDLADGRADVKLFLDRVRAVAFLATPHTGSIQASWIGRLRVFLWPTAATDDLRMDSPILSDLNLWYRGWVEDRPIRHLVLLEGRETAAGTIVGTGAGDPGLDKARVVPTDYDHLEIAKPADRSDDRYQHVLHFVQGVLQGLGMADGIAVGPGSAVRLLPLPPVVTGGGWRIGPIALRLLMLGLFCLVMALGIMSLVEKTLLGDAIEEAGATDVQQEVFKERVVEALRERGIADETIVGFLQGLDLSRYPEPEQFYNEFIGLAEKYSDLVKRNAAVAPADAEIAELKQDAAQEIRAGDLTEAERLVKSSELKAQLLREVQFHVADGRVVFDNGWDRENIVPVPIPQLERIPFPGSPGGISSISFHKDGAGQLKAVFAELQKTGLLGNLVQYCGSYNPRVIRGTQKTLSGHALGIALDVNCGELPFGRPASGAALKRILALVPIFEKHGFTWGGRFKFPDPMHFQLYEFE